jgi:hypothetical protein
VPSLFQSIVVTSLLCSLSLLKWFRTSGEVEAMCAAGSPEAVSGMSHMREVESAELREGAGERVLEEGWRRGVGDERTRGGAMMVVMLGWLFCVC